MRHGGFTGKKTDPICVTRQKRSGWVDAHDQLERLVLTHDLFAIAVRALVLGNVALAAAHVALRLHLHVEAGHHLLHGHAHALPVARVTLLDRAVLGARAAAFRAHDFFFQVNFALAAIVQLLECDLRLRAHVGSFLLAAATAAAAAKEGRERILLLWLIGALEALLAVDVIGWQ
jgi:hypothetical protein